MVYVDVHSHMDFKDFDVDRDSLINEMRENKIFTISNTLNRENFEYTRDLYKDCEDVVKVVPGLYPQDAEKISDEDFKNYLNYIKSIKKDIIAIGEVGLDRHKTEDRYLLDLQIERLREIIELAIEIDKPLILHTRKMEKETIDIIGEYVEKTGFRKFNLHCFSGKKKLIKDIKDLKIYCSIPLIIKNTESFRILVEELPIGQLLVETDSPFLNPTKERNSPLNIPEIYEEIANIKGLDLKEIENIIYRNYMKFTM